VTRPDRQPKEDFPTDEQRLGAIEPSIEVGTIVLVDDDVLACMPEQARAAEADGASTEASALQPGADEDAARRRRGGRRDACRW
jgi:hypothetical protein